MGRLQIANRSGYRTVYVAFGGKTLDKIPEAETVVFKLAPLKTTTKPTLNHVMKVFKSAEARRIYEA